MMPHLMGSLPVWTAANMAHVCHMPTKIPGGRVMEAPQRSARVAMKSLSHTTPVADNSSVKSLGKPSTSRMTVMIVLAAVVTIKAVTIVIKASAIGAAERIAAIIIAACVVAAERNAIVVIASSDVATEGRAVIVRNTVNVIDDDRGLGLWSHNNGLTLA